MYLNLNMDSNSCFSVAEPDLDGDPEDEDDGLLEEEPEDNPAGEKFKGDDDEEDPDNYFIPNSGNFPDDEAETGSAELQNENGESRQRDNSGRFFQLRFYFHSFVYHFLHLVFFKFAFLCDRVDEEPSLSGSGCYRVKKCFDWRGEA